MRPSRAATVAWSRRSATRRRGRNPHICARCIERAPEGGAVVPVAVRFADVRGYTALCEQLGPDEVASVVQTFYETSSSALLAHEGLAGQIAGDEIEGIFVPGWQDRTTAARPLRPRGRSCERSDTRRSKSASASRAARSSSGTWPVVVTRTSPRSATSRTWPRG